MITLEKTYQRESIPGIRKMVDKAVRSRSQSMTDSSTFSRAQRDQLREAYDALSPDEVYALCPFKGVLDKYPRHDFTKLFDYERELRTHTDSQKEMNEWANNCINVLSEQLWPKRRMM